VGMGQVGAHTRQHQLTTKCYDAGATPVKVSISITPWFRMDTMLTAVLLSLWCRGCQEAMC
jgi:hypothetical protein